MKKIALITGASRGIGFETALKLCENYDFTVVAISRNQEKLSKLEAIAPAGTIIPCLADISTGMQSVIELLKEKNISHIDLLINNAGLLVKKPFGDISIHDLEASFRVNVFAPYLTIQALLPWLRKAERPHVLNISSMGGFQGIEKFSGLSAYSTSKAALVCLTECLAVELKEDGISCNCLCLGAVETEMFAEAFPGFKAQVAASAMAGFIANFSVTSHQFMNGKIIPVSLSTP